MEIWSKTKSLGILTAEQSKAGQGPFLVHKCNRITHKNQNEVKICNVRMFGKLGHLLSDFASRLIFSERHVSQAYVGKHLTLRGGSDFEGVGGI